MRHPIAQLLWKELKEDIESYSARDGGTISGFSLLAEGDDRVKPPIRSENKTPLSLEYTATYLIYSGQDPNADHNEKNHGIT